MTGQIRLRNPFYERLLFHYQKRNRLEPPKEPPMTSSRRADKITFSLQKKRKNAPLIFLWSLSFQASISSFNWSIHKTSRKLVIIHFSQFWPTFVSFLSQDIRSTHVFEHLSHIFRIHQWSTRCWRPRSTDIVVKGTLTLDLKLTIFDISTFSNVSHFPFSFLFINKTKRNWVNP